MHRSNECLYGIYDLKDDEVCLGVCTLKQIASNYNTTPQYLHEIISKKLLFQGRYEIKRAF